MTAAEINALITEAMPAIERLPALRIVVERLAQHMSASLRSISGGEAEVTVERPRAMRVHDYLAGLPAPCVIAVIRIEPWDGHCLAALDAGLMGAAIGLVAGRPSQPDAGGSLPALHRDRAGGRGAAGNGCACARSRSCLRAGRSGGMPAGTSPRLHLPTQRSPSRQLRLSRSALRWRWRAIVASSIS